MQLLESHHQCPDCLFMELQFIPKVNNQFELYLNLKHNQQQEEILDGRVKFGLRYSKLLLTLNNLVFIEKAEINSSIITVANNVFSSQLIWDINYLSDGKFLQGNLTKIKLGVLELNSDYYELKAQIVAKKADIFITDIEGLWRHDITPNKHSILERKLAEFIENTQLTPYISQVIFCSKDANFSSTLPHQKQDNLTEKQALELRKIIQSIYLTTKNNFPELAQMAGLNPLIDFAGGDLTGVNLSGLSLSSGNFQAANLRGADLTDIDLSDGNLKYAKLNGADLSGAYLEGVNLENASLQNSSLALSNLIGANLINANLTNTNLQNTSFSNANVKGAIFGNNLGLEDDKKQELILKGAIFK
ncbi:MAG: pentapeptide repeat-containing protein [Cyanobacteria bacterium]|nr:pentapeptide repeat-containing protein [Cyanobacteria bacterium CG_2015-16_32_12]NCO77597.1 pentapeptide repeat-containing protein [Cyanobacteria bacterium CG_2015-22_32_23]NCQ41889.1 pentapeptide repeat-containing protein [Cyanobacteria bacterium CG_2015-04_32_10]NCS83443.1 pentapeptide repeat-containing protein [Cyanobacteria bacterium CG_2015-02_32_10]